MLVESGHLENSSRSKLFSPDVHVYRRGLKGLATAHDPHRSRAPLAFLTSIMDSKCVNYWALALDCYINSCVSDLFRYLSSLCEVLEVVG
jgi:hypothetical protein